MTSLCWQGSPVGLQLRNGAAGACNHTVAMGGRAKCCRNVRHWLFFKPAAAACRPFLMFLLETSQFLKHMCAYFESYPKSRIFRKSPRMFRKFIGCSGAEFAVWQKQLSQCVLCREESAPSLIPETPAKSVTVWSDPVLPQKPGFQMEGQPSVTARPDKRKKDKHFDRQGRQVFEYSMVCLQEMQAWRDKQNLSGGSYCQSQIHPGTTRLSHA